MPTIYGLEAVEVAQPDGEVLLYRIDVTACDPTAAVEEWAAWLLTHESDRTCRVAEHTDGSWSCSCEDFKYRFRHVRRQAPGGPCKHGLSLAVRAGLDPTSWYLDGPWKRVRYRHTIAQREPACGRHPDSGSATEARSVG